MVLQMVCCSYAACSRGTVGNVFDGWYHMATESGSCCVFLLLCTGDTAQLLVALLMSSGQIL